MKNHLPSQKVKETMHQRSECKNKIRLVSLRLMMLEGQQEDGAKVMGNGQADKHGQLEQIISMLISDHPCSHISKYLHGRQQHGNPVQRSFTS